MRNRKLHPLALCNHNTSRTNMQAVELLVTNLDANMDHICLKRELMQYFRENEIHVLHLSFAKQQFISNSNCWREYEPNAYSALKAIVKVASFQDAQIAVSKLHHAKLGCKRIMVSILSKDRSLPLNVLRREVISIFEEIPSKKLPLVTFQDIYEKRNHRSLSMGDIYRLRDVIQVTSEFDSGGKFVSVNPHLKATAKNEENEDVTTTNVSYCKLHANVDVDSFWIEHGSSSLPNVHMSLKLLAPRIHRLLDTHRGLLPLGSIIECYRSEFNEDFISEEPSVPLEHLISCVPGIEVTCARTAALKRIQWTEKKLEESVELPVQPIASQCNTASDLIAKQLNQFSREVKDLLKSQPHCLVSFSKFVPAYHNHFGRQCCVYQYGYTKLIDLLEAVSHVVQILGEGPKRVLTLTHREQTKRFAADLLKVLKAQPGKRLTLIQFPDLFAAVLEKPFCITDYGVCHVTDILEDLWEGTAIMKQEEEDIVVEIPKREQTEEEKKRTKLFAKDVIELLQSTPNFSISFFKFIPAYHHYFGRQCKVSDYGFIKLIELLEEITPYVIELIVATNGEDKIIRLNFENRLIAMRNRLFRIVKTHSNGCILISRLNELFRHEFGFSINFADYNASDMSSLIVQMPATFRLLSAESEYTVALNDDLMSNVIRRRIIRILMEEESTEMKIDALISIYKAKFNEELDIFVLRERMKHCIITKTKLMSVSLSEVLKLVRDCILVIQQMSSKSVTIRTLNKFYESMFKKTLPDAKELGYKTLFTLFQTQSEYLSVRRNLEPGKVSWVLTINGEFIGDKLSVSAYCDCEEMVREVTSVTVNENEDKHGSRSEEESTSNIVALESNQSVSNGVPKVPLPPNEWLTEKKEVANCKRLRRIAAKFDVTLNDNE
ncbi:meiosis arrest female protein 1-like protein [Leptotrombidium deliense]|uniref:Meiosis arrest female protein 1-like protein n=1 Tax=Leptotrombidium deliense TaxID=299467 RepID=A0A443SWY3_9ACAR|nr:meiosis arrest female protein 1-like protein [Leptotrombidium deliense]